MKSYQDKLEELNPEQQILLEEFREKQETALTLINEKLHLSEIFMLEAIKISEEFGTTFITNVGGISNTYVPNSIDHKMMKYEDIKAFLISTWQLEGYDEKWGYTHGWEHSQIC